MPLVLNFSISTTFIVTSSIMAVAVGAAFSLQSMQKSTGVMKRDEEEAVKIIGSDEVERDQISGGE